jgi:uncharacterized protein (UPF0276 family)
VSGRRRILEPDAASTRLGLAHGPGVPEFVAERPGLVDYVEVPFEQLRHTPAVGALQESVPLVLHCASMSVAGFLPPSGATLDDILAAATQTGTPWIGEHLAFISADGLTEDDAESLASPTALTYTVCPQLSEETVERVAENLAALQPRFPMPLILENSPQYFPVPGSTMNMVDFIREVAARTDVSLLLDLTHFLITSTNTGVDAAREIERMPLERVVEIHVSGLNVQSGVVWDDHATPAPAQVFELLGRVLRRVRPRALTLEYNWSAQFPRAVLLDHIDRARGMLDAA